jgi:phosphatidylglycerophosphatase GEP4
MNISGTLNVFKLLWNPTLCLPQHTVSTFNHLPIPLSKAFPKRAGKDGEKEVDIQAVVLDKDNCFSVPHTDEVYAGYKVWFSNLWFLLALHFFRIISKPHPRDIFYNKDLHSFLLLNN